MVTPEEWAKGKELSRFMLFALALSEFHMTSMNFVKQQQSLFAMERFDERPTEGLNDQRDV